MLRTLLFGKIHSCTITAANLNYMGSISIDAILLEAANILPYEQVQVVNVNNGQRFMTYAITAPTGSGAIELNGAAASS
jgi:aspartate 1-decarboxylase